MNPKYIMRYYSICLLLILLVCGCSFENNVRDKYNQWIGREVIIPSDAPSGLKIMLFVGKGDCYRCQLQLHSWRNFISEIRNRAKQNISLVMCIQTTDTATIYKIAAEEQYDIPLYFDQNGDIDKRNNFDLDYNFRCFLLDENNRVVLIGNPVQNPKIKDLYIRTICERLNINYSPKRENNLRKNLGVFSQNETKTVQFEIKNPAKKVLLIDSVFTSCECTKTKINKTEILQNESAVLTVIYKPDGIGDFIREIYVKIHNEEKPKIFEIEGKIE